MTTPMTPPAKAVDPTDCEREPIRTPGSIQPHGVLLVLDGRDLTVVQASENAEEMLGVPAFQALGRPLAYLLGDAAAETLRGGLTSAPPQSRAGYLGIIAVPGAGGRSFHAVAHGAEGGVILELEVAPDDAPIPAAHPALDAFTFLAEAAATVDDLARIATEAVRHLTGFDRVLLYRFDEGWNGTVIGEDGNGRLPSLLDFRFPAADIPAQARELYRINRVRIIPDAGYRPVPVVRAADPATGGPLDLTFSTLRSVSPAHVEYMRNMETAASMSVSILRDGKLWGLLSCHHAEPRPVPFPVREMCDLFGRVFTLRLSSLEHARDYDRRIEVRSAYATLLGTMADRGDFAAALVERPADLLAFADAGGAAVLTDAGCHLVGETPTEAQVLELAAWLFREVKDDVYATESLAAACPAAGAFKDRASGLLAVAVSKLRPGYVLWFRPEVVRTIKWGGDPSRPFAPGPDGARLHPRHSFEAWRETVRDRAHAWRPSELEGTGELRNAIVGIALRKAEELAAINAELNRSNKELEAFSYSVSHDLRAPLRHISGYAELLRESGAGGLSADAERYVATIVESSDLAGRLVDKLLGFSRLGRAELQQTPIDMAALIGEVRKEVMAEAEGRAVTWRVAALPAVTGDLIMIRMAVRDLLSNAVKYTRGKDPAVIEVSSRDEGGDTVFWVKDNGVGFDMQYAGKLFGVFQRLHRVEDFEGTGIGLANARRVMERHGGRAWAEGVEGQGAAFYFALPKGPK
jgi:chemotaxis family two-component system sensor kinase Cph1